MASVDGGLGRNCDFCTDDALHKLALCDAHADRAASRPRRGKEKERRERIATEVLAGMLGNPGCEALPSPLTAHEQDIVEVAVRYADFLIAALDKGD